MPLQTITIPVDVPDGYEAVAFRVADYAVDYFLSDYGTVIPPCKKSYLTHGPRLILRHVWKWPEWLTANWIAMDKNGIWFSYILEPVLEDADHWVEASVDIVGARRLDLGHFAFTPPPCTDWRQSKRQKPEA